MPRQNETLHGNVPEHCPTALLLIDVINDFEFEGGDILLKYSRPMAKNLSKLKSMTRRAGIPAIYVNDNFGRWNSDFRKILGHASSPRVRGKSITHLLRPNDNDYFVLKPKHSGFFSTTLELVLKYLSVENLILTGLTTDSCLLFTANDAYVRDYKLYVPSDCSAAISPLYHRAALAYMRRVLGADTRASSELDLVRLASVR